MTNAGTATDELQDLRRRLEQAEEARRRAELALKESEERFQAFLDNSPCVAFLKEPGGRHVYVNQPFRELFRWGPGDPGATDAERFPPEVARHLREHDEVVLNSGRALETIEEVPTPDEVLRSWLVFKFPVPDGAGKRLLGGVAIDITERQRAEAALRESEAFHRAISELTSDYAYSCTVDALGIARLESVTAGFTRVTGFTLDEVRARGDWPSLIHPDDLGAANANFPDILAGKRGVYELRLVTRSGSVRWIRYSTHPLWDTEAKRVGRFIGAVQDITEDKQAEAQLRESTRRLQHLSRRLLEVQEQERRRLARELHDEVGQALTGLKLSLEAASREPVSDPMEGVGLAQELVLELMARVRDLSLDLRPSMLDDLGLGPALEWHFRRYTAITGVRIQFEKPDLVGRLPAEVETAAYRIVQEALTNVARHSGAREATVRLWCVNRCLYVQIADNGCGFDFPATTTTGASSGLSGMQERTELLGGRLKVESSPGAGTRVTAELPMVE